MHGSLSILLNVKGYLSQIQAQQRLGRQMLHLITKQMRSRLRDISDTLLLRKRAITKGIIDQPKSICQIEHSTIAVQSTSWSTYTHLRSVV
jgi:hypothetical protein